MAGTSVCLRFLELLLQEPEGGNTNNERLDRPLGGVTGAQVQLPENNKWPEILLTAGPKS